MTDAEHCRDCCCARSWAALGISEYTGKSIPEHIAALRQELRGRTQNFDDACSTIAQLEQERDAARAEAEALRHDVERHVAIAADQATDIEALRQDALRYRWLRDHMTWTTHEEFPGTDLSYLTRRWYHETTIFRASTIDEVVDAALAGKGAP